MAQELVLKAENRENTGTKNAQRLRQEGKMPAVVYGHGKDPVSIILDTHDFVEGIHHGHRVMDLEMPEGKATVMIKDLQYDYLSRFIIHADLIRVDVTERVTVEVPIELKGEPKGTQEEGGILEPQADAIEIECVVTNIPESLPVSVDEMELGDSLLAKDVKLPSGVKLVSDPEFLIAVCRFVEEEKTTEELEEEMPEAPEVIGEEKEEEEGEEGEGTQQEPEQGEQKEE
jgi:large subunit ribosomal protein L25